MFWCKVRINHRHFYIGMTQNIAQNQYVSAVHHKVAGEGMAKHVGALPSGKSIPARLTARSKAFLHGVNSFPLFWGVRHTDPEISVLFGFLAFGFGIGDPEF